MLLLLPRHRCGAAPGASCAAARRNVPLPAILQHQWLACPRIGCAHRGRWPSSAAAAAPGADGGGSDTAVTPLIAADASAAVQEEPSSPCGAALPRDAEALLRQQLESDAAAAAAAAATTASVQEPQTVAERIAMQARAALAAASEKAALAAAAKAAAAAEAAAKSEAAAAAAAAAAAGEEPTEPGASVDGGGGTEGDEGDDLPPYLRRRRDKRSQLPPPPEEAARIEAERAAGLAAVAEAQPWLDPMAVVAYYEKGLFKARRLTHDGVQSRIYRPPAFLKAYPVPPGCAFNFNSFMGALDPHGGKYYVPPQLLRAFLREMHDARRYRSAKLCLSENYNKRAYRLFQELDFDWALPIDLVLQLVPRLAKIVVETAAEVYGLPEPPVAIVSMRTPYKVHLNFPAVVTTESRARRARKAIINRCRAELSGLPPLALLKEEVVAAEALARAEAEMAQLVAEEARLRQLASGSSDGDGDGSIGGVQPAADEAGAAAAADAAPGSGGGEAGAATPVVAAKPFHPLLASIDWEAVVDVPHGSLRLPGCYKSPWMDKDPAWVEEKGYSVVEWRPDSTDGEGSVAPSSSPFGAGEGGAWYKLPLTAELLQACSIHPTPEQVEEYERSPAFLEDAFEDMERKRERNSRRNGIKSRRKAVKALRAELGLAEPSGGAAVAAAGGGGLDSTEEEGEGGGVEGEGGNGDHAEATTAAQQQQQQQQQQVEVGGVQGRSQQQQQQQQQQEARREQQRPPSLAEVATAALEEQRRRAEEKRQREAAAAEKRQRAEELLREADRRLAGKSAGAAPTGPAKPQVRGPSRPASPPT